MTDDELDELLASLPRSGPGPDFADRVMARVTVAPVAAPVPAPVPASARRRWLAAVAALAVVLVGVAGSVLWAASHWAMLFSLGRRFADTASGWLLDGARHLAAEFIRSPGAAVLERFAGDPRTLLVAFAAGSLLYLSGLLLLRHLILTPRQAAYGR